MSDYDAFEVEDGSCLDEVEHICHHLTNGGQFNGQFGVDQPDVDVMISATYYEMVAMLAEYFYAPVQTDPKVLGLLQFYNALGASAKVELAFATTGYANSENTRHVFLWDQFETGFAKLLNTNALSVMGAAQITDPRGEGLSAGGISLSDKTQISQDTDNAYSFTRKLMDNPQAASQSIITNDSINRELP